MDNIQKLNNCITYHHHKILDLKSLKSCFLFDVLFELCNILSGYLSLLWWAPEWVWVLITMSSQPAGSFHWHDTNLHSCVTINHDLWLTDVSYLTLLSVVKKQVFSGLLSWGIKHTVWPIYCLTDHQQSSYHVMIHFSFTFAVSAPLLRVSSVCCVGSWHQLSWKLRTSISCFQ
jgi:hypothetical protein